MKSVKFLFLMAGTVLVPLVLFWFTGCTNNGENPPSGNFSLSVSRGTQMSKTSANSLVITSAKIIVSNLRIKGKYIDTTNIENDDDVDEVVLKDGPFVLPLTLGNDSNVVLVNNVSAGTYYGAKFEIHKLQPGEVSPDTEFYDSTTGRRYSIVVHGTYNGTPFTFKSSMSAKQMVVFQQPIVITTTGFINVTLLVDPYSWFTVNGQLINPLDVNSSVMINALIRASFKQGFKDHGGWHEEGHCWGWEF
ncbi:MAG: hypothetical protein P4L45_13105 [Ignavibacteriaceae bacterium]|nr:hypothetical protein [Ignavibacteriaceae bacterium]